MCRYATRALPPRPERRGFPRNSGESYPMDIDFVLELPSELRDLFTAWATSTGYDPMDPDAGKTESAQRHPGNRSARFGRPPGG